MTTTAFRPSLKRKITGWSLLVLGALGVVLPILQGVLFLALGLFVLRDQYPWAHRGLERMRRRWPRHVTRVEALEARLVARSRDWARRAKGLIGRS